MLQSIGIEDKAIMIDAKKLIKIRNKHPEMTDEMIKKIPEVIENPMVILDSLTKPGRPVLLGDVVDSEKRPLLIALELEAIGEKGTFDEIKIASAYARNNAQYLLDNSKYYYINDNIKKTKNWLKRTRLQLPVGINQFGLIDTIISTKTQKINTNLKKII